MSTRTAGVGADHLPRAPPVGTGNPGRSYSTRSARSGRPVASVGPSPVGASSGAPTQASVGATSAHHRQLSHSSYSHSNSQSHSYATSHSRSNSSANANTNVGKSHIPPHLNQHQHQRTSSSARSYQPQSNTQNEYDASHLAAANTVSHQRSSSRDRPVPPARGPDPSRAHRKSTSRSNNNHRNNHHDMTPSATLPSNGVGAQAAQPSQPHGHADAPPRTSTSKHARSRTVIPTQSGKWMLGKTVGAGSMGKVKLAKKEDGSEQVRHLAIHDLWSSYVIAKSLDS